MLDVNERVAMVSGAAGGVGGAVARRLINAGWRVSAGDIRPGALDAGPNVLLQSYDAKSAVSAAEWVEATVRHFGRIDALVNCAAIFRRFGVTDDDESLLQDMWAVNVLGPLRTTRLALPHLKQSGAGRIVNLASMQGKRMLNANVGYAMTKAAVLTLTQATRQEAWSSGVRVVSICPSVIATDMGGQSIAFAGKDPDSMIQPADLAEVIATVMALPNSASIPEVMVLNQPEHY